MRGHEVAQLFFRDALAVDVGVTAEQTDRHVGGCRQHPDHRAHEPREPVEGRSDRTCRALRTLQRHALGGELADDERHVGDEKSDDEEPEDLRAALAEAGMLE